MLRNNSTISALAPAALVLGLASSAEAQDRCSTNFPPQISRITDDAKAQIINLDGILPDQQLVDLSNEPCDNKIRGVFENPNYSQSGLVYKYTNCPADTNRVLNTSATPDTAPINVMETSMYGTIVVTTIDTHIFQANLGEYRLATTQNLDPNYPNENYQVQNLLLSTAGESNQPLNIRLQKSTTPLFMGEGLAPELITIDGTTTFDSQVHMGVISPDNREDQDPDGAWIRLDAVNCREAEKAIVAQSTDLNGYPVAGQVWIITESNLRPRTYVTELRLTTDGNGNIRWTNCGPSSDARYATPIRDTNGNYVNTIGKPLTVNIQGAGLMTFILAPDSANPHQEPSTFGTALYSLSGPLPVCFGVTCEANEYCDPGTGNCRTPDSIDPCEGVVCGPSEVCIEGACAPDEEADAGPDAEDSGSDTDIVEEADMDNDTTDDADLEKDANADMADEPDAQPDMPGEDVANSDTGDDTGDTGLDTDTDTDMEEDVDTGTDTDLPQEDAELVCPLSTASNCPPDKDSDTTDTGADSGNNQQPRTPKPKEEGCATAPGEIQGNTKELLFAALALSYVLKRRKDA